MDVDITVRFQPIVDLAAGRAIGWEVLSRAEPPFQFPEEMFTEARRQGRLWEIEQACRVAAIRAIAELPDAHRRARFFINVSPDIFEDPRFEQGFTIGALDAHGVDPKTVVIEITERSGVLDYRRFERLIRHYVDQGLEFAVDDFGSGHSGLITLFRTAPSYLKLDMALVRHIEDHPYRQQLVRSLLGFADSVDCALVAEGVETEEELEVLVRLGVRYAQGFLLGRPERTPLHPPPDLGEHVQNMTLARRLRSGDLEETLGGLVAPARTLGVGTTTVEELEAIFRREPDLDHVVFVDGDAIQGLLTRNRIQAGAAGPLGSSLLQSEPAEVLAKADPLIVDASLEVVKLSSRAMDRPPEDLYDPVLVRTPEGPIGSITMKQLITRAIELEVQTARGANPLTGLPGNRILDKWIGGALDRPDFAIVYADLDRFKEYNDRYGFLLGDEMIRLCAQVLTQHLSKMADDARLGHIGGDDFVIVCPDGIRAAGLDGACALFDEEKRRYFDPDDLARGTFEARSRRGRKVTVPLVTLSLAVIERRKLGRDEVHPALLSQLAASLKKKVKQRTAKERRSTWMAERRART